MAARAIWWIAAALAVSANNIVSNDTPLSRSYWFRCYNHTNETDELDVIHYNTTILDLHDSNIATLNALNIKCYPNLLQLQLNGNMIKRIGIGTFDTVIALQNLFLEDNVLLGRRLAPNLFSKCRQLRTINFSGNDMSDTPAELFFGLSRLESLYMNSCSLHELPAILTYSFLPNLKRLQLKSNEISELHRLSFVNVSNLESIYLSNNKIKYLHEELLKPLTAIVHIFMPCNKIRYIPEGFFNNKASLSYIDLSENLLESVSTEAFFGTGLKVLNLSGNRLTYLPDQFCSKLQSIDISLEQFYFAGNPWQCSCLNEVLVETKRLSIRYEFVRNHDGRFKFDGEHPVCIMADDFKCHRIDLYQNLFNNFINGRQLSLNYLN